MDSSSVRTIAFTFLLLASGLATHGPAAAQSGNDWTILVYLDAEGNLEESGVDNMLEMEHLGAGATSRVLVQMDRGEGYDTRDGDWEGTKRLEVPRDGVDSGGRDNLASTVLADLGEVNMGDPQTLVDFLAWGVETAPAEHYMVILWDHGGAWNGVAFDHTPIEDHLSLAEIGSGLDEGRKAAGIAAWDIVYFDACVMGALEVTHAVGTAATIVIASEELVPGAGGSYGAMMEALREGDVSVEEMAGRITASFAARYAGAKGTGAGGHACKGACGTRSFDSSYQWYTDDSAVLSWYHMAYEADLWAAWTAFNGVLKENAASEWPALVRAARDAERFSYEDAKSPNAMDVGDFAARVRDVTGHAAVRDAANGVLGALANFIGATTTSPSHPGATGIMTKFPVPAGGPPAAADKPGAEDVYETDPSLAGAGDAFAAITEAAYAGDTEEPQFGDIEVFSEDGWVDIWITVDDPNAVAVDVAVTDEMSEFGEVLAWIAPSSIEITADGLFAEFEWDGTVLALVGEENDDEPIIAPAFRESLEATEYMLDGVYRVGANGEEQDAFLRFDLDGTFLSAWMVGDLASEIKPRAGDSFAILFMGWEDGEPIDLVDVWVPAGGSGAASWRLEEVALSGGATGFSAYAEDLAGNAALSDPIVIELPEPAFDEEYLEAGVEDHITDLNDVNGDANGDAALHDDEEWDDSEAPGVPFVMLLAAIALIARMRRR